ncbi:hypothetical protein NVI2019_PEGOAJLN_02498 [Providencia alcalifaciens]|uniref:hypothetical protein n=1 Tax=Providencia alcalifaciens TaxID=126385 RepID=UPI00044DBDDC|nr:hypothetical protein [Providencia alcalifaciens]EUD03010.1 hypothetical protein HMPREF1565_3146 [Providencia alcalifaciens RIMD 1656011]CAG9425404.1 hypothetical protein NVI2019_PEGOAJLN_02498 [Providencia alcalifaciens]
MISTSSTFDRKFIGIYKSKIIVQKVIPSLTLLRQKVCVKYLSAFDLCFSEKKVTSMILSPADKLEQHINFIEDNFLLLIERFNPSRYLKNIHLDDDLDSLNARQDASKINEIKGVLIVDFTLNLKNDYFLKRNLLSQLQKSKTPTQTLKVLKDINNIIKGCSKKRKEYYKSNYPDWLNELPDSFKYKDVSDTYGLDIVTKFDFRFCPYCNDEPIPTIVGANRNYRTAIDHFYPKAKYPFLAVSLFNFIPAGNRCNTGFKSETDMVGYFNPSIHKLKKEALFDFIFSPDNKIQHDTLIVSLNQNDDLLNKNISLFELESVYNNDECKIEIEKIHERILHHRSLGDEHLDSILSSEKLIRREFNVDLFISAKHVRWQKYFVDFLNQICNRDYTIKLL